MDAQAEEILRFFRELPDPRAANARHLLSDILSIAIMGVFCGADGWAAVEQWAHCGLSWLQTILDLPHGVPSHDTFDRVFGLIDPDAFEKCFMNWTAELAKSGRGKFVAIDGKTLRRSFTRGWKKTPAHLLSAFTSANHLVLGQLKTDEQSNEITAIPRLLALLDIKGTTVTIDAIGCQKEIAAQIIQQKGHYVLAVKSNQETLHAKVKSLLDEAILEGFHGMKHDHCSSVDGDHGRIETRRLWCTPEVHWLKETAEQWPGLKSIVVIESTREIKDSIESPAIERRYFISSHDGTDAQLLAEAIRGHWGIENGLHWCLDVAMGEDQCRLRMKHGAENFSRLRRIALNKLKRHKVIKPNGKELKVGIKIKQQGCGWSRQQLLLAMTA